MRRRWLLYAWICLLPSGAVWSAPNATTGVSAGPYFIGVPVHVEVRVSDIEESPTPSVEVKAPEGADLVLVSTAPRISSSVQIINGQMKRWKDVTYVIRYRLTANREGAFEIGPFHIEQGQLKLIAPARRLDVGNVPDSNEQRLTVRWPKRTLWVGEQVPVTIEWWVSTALAERIASRSVRIPLFNMTDALNFSTPPDTSAQNTLAVQTSSGRIELPARVRRESRGGTEFLVLRAKRVMTPLMEADLQMQPASVVIEEAIRWQRNLFGERVATDVRRVQAQSEAGQIQIREPPSSGRPPSFAGIVGSGFTITVSANRSVVTAGDPIGLEVTVRGDGALDTLALPSFNALGFNEDNFKTPANTVTGRVEADGAKRFRFNVRPLHEHVEAIGALTLSWFDADTGAYASTRSAPVALSVRAAERISAADVVSRADPTPAAATPPPASGTDAQAPRAVPTPSATEFSDLSIETRADRLVSRPSHSVHTRWFHAFGYLSAFGILGLGVLWRRRREADPGARQQRLTLISARRGVSAATSVATISHAMRQLIAALGVGELRDDVDALLARCDAAQYSRSEPQTSELETLRETALELIARRGAK